jgi:hypothetical protein
MCVYEGKCRAVSNLFIISINKVKRMKSCIVAMLAVLVCISLGGSSWGQNWSDGFNKSKSVSDQWINTGGMKIDETGGFKLSGVLTGAADGHRYGSIWRKTPGGKSIEMTARIKVGLAGEWTGAVIGLSTGIPGDVGNPLTPAYSPNVALAGNYLGIRVVEPRGGEKGYAQLQLTYGNPYCGQTLPYRLGKLDLNTWYEVKLQAWQSDGAYLATAWYRRDGEKKWTDAGDNWPGKRHVVAYEGFEPVYAAVMASPGAFVDDVNVKSIPAPVQKRISPARNVNNYPFTIISLSWSSPDTKFMQVNLANMEKTPLDGWATYAAYPRLPQGRALYGWGTGDLGWEVFQNKKATRDQIQPAIDDLKSFSQSRFRSNYIANVSYLTTPAMDWFDDAWWANIAENAKLQGALAKEGGCEGILFDPEMYGCSFWGWPSLSKDPLYKGKTYKQVQAKVRQRGREYVRAINSAYPGIRIISIHAWDTALRYEDPRSTKATLQDKYYGLLPAFLDGMLEGSDDKTVIIDGCEATYWVDAFPDFVERAQAVRTECIKLSEVPALFKKKVRVGFAIYLDRDWRGNPWNSDVPAVNHWTPERLAQVVGNALAAGDGIVWIYSETATWHFNSPQQTMGPYVRDIGWHGAAVKYVQDGYREALDKGRKRATELRIKYGK